MLVDGVLESGHAIEREEPDSQREHVVLLERPLQVRVVDAAVDVAVDPLVEIDQRALVVLARRLLELVEQHGTLSAVFGRRPVCCQPRGERLEHEAHFGQTREVADVDAGDEDAPPREHLDELFPGERAERFADGVRPTPRRCISSRSSRIDPGAKLSETISSRIRKYAWSLSDLASAASGWWT